MDLDRTQTYSQDLPLFKELGLKPFDIPCWRKHLIGKVKLENTEVTIWIEGAPAQFFEFLIINKVAKRRYHVTTGSGSLSGYWNAIKMLAEGMLVIDEIEWQEKEEGGGE